MWVNYRNDNGACDSKTLYLDNVQNFFFADDDDADDDVAEADTAAELRLSHSLT